MVNANVTKDGADVTVTSIVETADLVVALAMALNTTIVPHAQAWQ